jgi:hypothetical protein
MMLSHVKIHFKIVPYSSQKLKDLPGPALKKHFSDKRTASKLADWNNIRKSKFQDKQKGTH